MIKYWWLHKRRWGSGHTHVFSVFHHTMACITSELCWLDSHPKTFPSNPEPAEHGLKSAFMLALQSRLSHGSKRNNLRQSMVRVLVTESMDKDRQTHQSTVTLQDQLAPNSIFLSSVLLMYHAFSSLRNCEMFKGVGIWQSLREELCWVN